MPAREKEFHIITEALAVLIVAPALAYIGFQQHNPQYKIFLLGLSLLIVLIDGYLLSQRAHW